MEAKKAALQRQLQTITAANLASPTKQPIANPREAGNLNSGLFYGHEVFIGAPPPPKTPTLVITGPAMQAIRHQPQ